MKCRVPICYEYIDITIRKDERGRADTKAMLPPPPTKPITLPNSVVLAGEGGKRKKKNRGNEEKKKGRVR